MMRAFTSGRFLRFFYAQEQPKNVFKLPRRFDLTTEAYSEV